MFQSTIIDDLADAERFARVYSTPIREAFRSLGLSAEDADDQTQNLLIRLVSRDLVSERGRLHKRFRDWLFCCIKNQAMTHFRRGRKQDAAGGFELVVPIEPEGEARAKVDEVDLHYAISIFNLTLREVRRHWEEMGRPEVWHVFEELVLAPLVPGREALTRDELRARYPGRVPNFLDNCCTSVKRTILRVLPAMIPPELTDKRAPEERFAEWLAILRDSGALLSGRLHHAFETGPPCDPSAAIDASVAFAPGCGRDDRTTGEDPELSEAEHRVVLGIWLAMPLRWYLDRELVDAAFGPPTEAASAEPSLLNLVAAIESDTSEPGTILPVLDALKTFAKQVHRAVSPNAAEVGEEPTDRARRAHSMTTDVALALYNLSGALALVGFGERIVSLSPEQLRTNLSWMSSRRWVDERLKRVLREARMRLSDGRR